MHLAVVRWGWLRRRWRLLALVVAAAVAVGATVESPFAPAALIATCVAASWLIGFANWRAAVVLLLAYIPISGIPIILTYPSSTWAVLLKDLVFTLPAYLGFVSERMTKRSDSVLIGPVVLLALFAAVVIVEIFNPALPSIAVGLAGAKVWLFYVPLFFLGYHLVSNGDDLTRLFALLSLTALVPASIGIMEWLLAANGADIYTIYGAAAPAVSQNFATFVPALGLVIHRIPSTFSFVTQYYFFTCSAIVFSHAWLRSCQSIRDRVMAALCLGITTIAALTSGQRGAYIFVPVLVLGLITAQRGRAALISFSVFATVVGGAFAFVGGGIAQILFRLSFDIGVQEFASTFISGITTTLDRTWFGFGAGSSTAGSRYLVADPTQLAGFGFEGWYVNALNDLGIIGLGILLALLSQLIWRAIKSMSGLADARMRAVAGSLVVFLLWILAYSLKASPVELDPVNVYFWLIVGLVLSLPELEVRGRRPAVRGS